MVTAPFVTFQLQPTAEISNTPTLIFGNDRHTCLLDSLLLTNVSEETIQVTVSLAREVTVGQESYFTVFDQAPIAPQGWADVLTHTTLTLQPGDLLYAASNHSSHVFNTFLSYRELWELPQ